MRGFSERSARSADFATLVVTSLWAASVAAALKIAWDPPARTYLEYVPIGTVVGTLICDRLLPRWSGNVPATACDALVVGLAAMRAVIPPFPFVSGHTLLAAYALMTAQRWPLQVVALVALAEVVYTKVFASGGVGSFVGGLLVAGALAGWWRRATKSGAAVSFAVFDRLP
jgi:hypothetical protein